MSARGTLSWKSSGSVRTLTWNGNAKQLVGFTQLGVVNAWQLFSSNGNPDPLEDPNCFQQYLGTLKQHNVNFTRVFLVNPWLLCSTHPFRICSTSCPNNPLPYQAKLELFNSVFLDKLHDFVTKAWDRGIVVQVTMFDRCGLWSQSTLDPIEGDNTRVWKFNPYNSGNRCGTYTGFFAMGDQYPTDFGNISKSDVATIHRTLITKVKNRLSDCGNVIFEIMNEPANKVFPGTTPEQRSQAGVDFHNWVAGKIN